MVEKKKKNTRSEPPALLPRMQVSKVILNGGSNEIGPQEFDPSHLLARIDPLDK